MLLLQDGWTALHYACRYGYIEVVKHLVNNKADISAATNVSDHAVATYVYHIINCLIFKYSYPCMKCFAVVYS